MAAARSRTTGDGSVYSAYRLRFVALACCLLLLGSRPAAHAQAPSREARIEETLRSVETAWAEVERTAVAPLLTQKFRWIAAEALRRTGRRLALGEAWGANDAHWQAAMEVIVKDLDAQAQAQSPLVDDGWRKFAEQLAALETGELDDVHRFYSGAVFRRAMGRLANGLRAFGTLFSERPEQVSELGQLHKILHSVLAAIKERGLTADDRKQLEAELATAGMQSLARNRADMVDFLLNDSWLFRIPAVSKQTLVSIAGIVRAFRETGVASAAPRDTPPADTAPKPAPPPERSAREVNWGTPLHAAVLQGNKAAVVVLIARGANGNARSGDYRNSTPIDEIRRAANIYPSHGRIARLLVDAGAQVHLPDGPGSESAVLRRMLSQ